jgi:hypothetical protein
MTADRLRDTALIQGTLTITATPAAQDQRALNASHKRSFWTESNRTYGAASSVTEQSETARGCHQQRSYVRLKIRPSG